MKALLPIVLFCTLLGCTNSNNPGDASGNNNNNQTPGNTSSEAAQLTKTAEMLSEEVYWNVISKSLAEKENQEKQKQALLSELEKLSPAEIVGFQLRTNKMMRETYNSAMLCAAYIMNAGCSNDCFENFRAWVISRGKDVYDKAKENPDNLVSEATANVGSYEFESFRSVPLDAFEHKTGKLLYDYIDNDKIPAEEKEYPEMKADWEEDNPESMKAICPQLYDKLARSAGLVR